MFHEKGAAEPCSSESRSNTELNAWTGALVTMLLWGETDIQEVASLNPSTTYKTDLFLHLFVAKLY